MMRSNAGELVEPRKPKQRDSSAMPQKKNPIMTERLMGLARRIRGMAGEAFENVATPEGRDISQSSVERHIFPDATALLHYMAETATRLVEGLVVNVSAMKTNLHTRSLDVWAAQRVRIALVGKGVDPNLAYVYTQEVAFEARETGQPFYLLLCDQKVSDTLPTAVGIIGKEALQACFDPMSYLRPGIEKILGR
jgi:adenylosuccinate lyase